MYWNELGKICTQPTIELALKTAAERKINYIVVASNQGDTAKLLMKSGFKVICVTHANGYSEPGVNEMSNETRSLLEENDVRVLTTTHVLSGAERGLSAAFSGVYPLEIMAHTLRMFGQGVKVCVEIAVMALDSGLIPHGESIIAIGGSSRGADTAIILRPAHAKEILNTRIEEIICKPR